MFLYNNPDNSKETVDNSFFFSVELWITALFKLLGNSSNQKTVYNSIEIKNVPK